MLNPGANALTPELEAAVRGELRPGERLVYAGRPAPKYHARLAWPLSVFGLFFGGFAAFWISMAAAGVWFGGGVAGDAGAARSGASDAGEVGAGQVGADKVGAGEADDQKADDHAGDHDAGTNAHDTGDGSRERTEGDGDGTSSAGDSPADGLDATDVLRGGIMLFPLFGVPFLLVGLGMILSPVWIAHTARRTVCCVTNRRAMQVVAGRATRVQSWTPDQFDEIAKTVYRDGNGSIVFARSAGFSSRGRRTSATTGFRGVPDPDACEQALLDLKDGALRATSRNASAPRTEA